jgi:prepilin-type N-terminal cleavage/methylation domain-containing protein
MRRAFTLMEVIIATGVFALMAVVLTQAVIQVQNAIHETQDFTTRGDFSRFVMRRALAATSREALTTSGSATLPDGSGVTWAVTLEPTTLPDLHEVTIELNWDDKPAEILTLRAYRPEWSEASERSVLQQDFSAQYPASRLATY